MTTVKSLGEVRAIVGALQVAVTNSIAKKTIDAIGTPDERPVMTDAMDRALDVANKLRELVNAGLTYEAWREQFIGTLRGDGYVQSLEDADGTISKGIDELSSLDLREYFEAEVLPEVSGEAINAAIEMLEERKRITLEMWAEEDADA